MRIPPPYVHAFNFNQSVSDNIAWCGNKIKHDQSNRRDNNLRDRQSSRNRRLHPKPKPGLAENAALESIRCIITDVSDVSILHSSSF